MTETKEQLHAYDVKVARQLEWLKAKKLAVHIPAKGTPYFTKKVKKHARA